MSDEERIIMCKFRTTNHRLIIENGRWHNIDRNDIICPLYDADLMGDEFHYLLEYSYFYDARNNFMGENDYVRPYSMKYKNLMNTKMLKKSLLIH